MTYQFWSILRVYRVCSLHPKAGLCSLEEVRHWPQSWFAGPEAPSSTSLRIPTLEFQDTPLNLEVTDSVGYDDNLVHIWMVHMPHGGIACQGWPWIILFAMAIQKPKCPRQALTPQHTCRTFSQFIIIIPKNYPKTIPLSETSFDSPQIFFQTGGFWPWSWQPRAHCATFWFATALRNAKAKALEAQLTRHG